ncbi:nectin-4-like isoform X1 [Gadus chalcogrammus]|uniref:nectin-4-like isoform X1 n=1 Tax=Gadus chalcogrammus TaxID=1042646 RepID=UPI0024C4B840|nr:nectin-4-like isoform X1 [Gadus chalcogrammus]
MNLRTAARGFVAFLLSVPALQGYSNWAVTYPSSNICALRGSTVEIRCNYKYPYANTVEKKLWFTNIHNEPVDLKDDTDYTGRVKYSCVEHRCSWSSCTGTCTLRIENLTQSDSAEYKFRITTNNEGAYSGVPGVKLSVTDLQVKVVIPPSSPNRVQLECHSMCHLTGYVTYIWYRDGTRRHQGRFTWFNINSEYRTSCAVQGSEHLPSPSVYAPETPSVGVTPPGVIKEGSSVNLTCTSEANPVAKYTWSKVTTGHPPGHSVKDTGQQLSFHPIQSSDSGQYLCTAENDLGTKTSSPISIDGKSTPSSLQATVAAGTVAVLLVATILLLIFLWMRRKRASRKARGQGGRPDTRQESPPCPVYDNVSALTNRSASAAQREPIEEQDDPHYASIHISRSKNQEVPRGFAGVVVESDHTEQVLYSAINLNRPKAVPE